MNATHDQSFTQLFEWKKKCHLCLRFPASQTRLPDARTPAQSTTVHTQISCVLGAWCIQGTSAPLSWVCWLLSPFSTWNVWALLYHVISEHADKLPGGELTGISRAVAGEQNYSICICFQTRQFYPLILLLQLSHFYPLFPEGWGSTWPGSLQLTSNAGICSLGGLCGLLLSSAEISTSRRVTHALLLSPADGAVITHLDNI